jgi:hypothetical protein
MRCPRVLGSNLTPRCFYWATNTHELHHTVQVNSTEMAQHTLLHRDNIKVRLTTLYFQVTQQI